MRKNRITLVCETCNRTFERKRSLVKPGTLHHYCSITCRASAPPAPAILNPDGLTARLPLQARDGSITGYALIDAGLVAWAQQWRWQLSRSRRVTRGERGNTYYLHREILGLSTGDTTETDHINRDTLDNRRANLRKASREQNAQNLPVRPNGSSRYRGVCWFGPQQRWVAYVNVSGKRAYTAYFSTEEEAAEAARKARARLLPFATD
jgi:hypothetical protein